MYAGWGPDSGQGEPRRAISGMAGKERMARKTGGEAHQAPIIDQGSRPGPVTRLIVFTIVLAVAAVVFALFREHLGDQFLLGLLGVLAMIGTGEICDGKTIMLLHWAALNRDKLSS